MYYIGMTLILFGGSSMVRWYIAYKRRKRSE